MPSKQSSKQNSPAGGEASGGSKGGGKHPRRIPRPKKKPWNEFLDLTVDSDGEVCAKCGQNGHEESACKQPQGRGGPRWSDMPEAGPSRPRDEEGEGSSAENADDRTAPKNKFTPFKRMAYTFDFGDSDEEVKEGEGGTTGDGGGLKDGEAAAKPPSPPPPPPPGGTPPPPPLLLPEHVTMDDENEDAAGQEAPPLEAVDENADMTGIAVLDDSISTGAIRYYDPRATDEFFATADLRSLCKRCKKPGHIERNCDVEICLRCGEEGHERMKCPYGVTCRYCGLSGHSSDTCEQRAVQRDQTGSTGCSLCGSHRHGTTGCELAWRTYVYYPPDVRKEVLKAKAEARSWRLEAVGANPSSVFCFNCASEGHLGDDCPRPKGTRAPITAYPTAFSAAMARRGPYAASALPAGRGTHTRFDDNLPGANPGFAGFGGANPGQRGREKERARQRERDRRRNNRDDDDRDDWFARRDRDRDAHDGRSRGAWTRQRSPERRSAPAGGSLASRISGMGTAPRFGAMSAPGGRNDRRSDRDRGARYGGEAELEEGEWRASGAGGGPVEGWGAEMDRAEREARRARDDRPRAGPSRRGGAARGQRYTGGY